VLHQLMEDQPFVSLVTMGVTKGSPGLFASHIPMVLERGGSGLGTLRGHLSRANAQWREYDASVEALAIFSGPHHYITPNWYPEKEATHKVVPTWNYAVVHAYGHIKVIEDGQWLMRHLESLTMIHEAAIHEAASAIPWKVGDAPADFIASQVKGIVGLEIVIERLEGKWKVSQNRSEQDRSGVARGLAELNTAESLAMKALVEKRG
jgi:transcriptional regulator